MTGGRSISEICLIKNVHWYHTQRQRLRQSTAADVPSSPLVYVGSARTITLDKEYRRKNKA